MTKATILEEQLDVDFTETETNSSIVEERLDVVVKEVNFVTDITPDSLTAEIVEEHLDVSIKENHLDIALIETIDIGSGIAEVLHLEREFTYADISAGSISLGLSPKNKRIQNTFLDVEEVFDNGLQVTIGTSTSQALLMRVDENNPLQVGQYKGINNVKYDDRPEFFLFFNAVSPTQGKARATIYFN